MKATVNENCIGCGLCAGTCPVVFTMGDDGLAHGGEIPANQQTEAETARDGCPVSGKTCQTSLAVYSESDQQRSRLPEKSGRRL